MTRAGEIKGMIVGKNGRDEEGRKLKAKEGNGKGKQNVETRRGRD